MKGPTPPEFSSCHFIPYALAINAKGLCVWASVSKVPIYFYSVVNGGKLYKMNPWGVIHFLFVCFAVLASTEPVHYPFCTSGGKTVIFSFLMCRQPGAGVGGLIYREIPLFGVSWKDSLFFWCMKWILCPRCAAWCSLWLWCEVLLESAPPLQACARSSSF